MAGQGGCAGNPTTAGLLETGARLIEILAYSRMAGRMITLKKRKLGWAWARRAGLPAQKKQTIKKRV